MLGAKSMYEEFYGAEMESDYEFDWVCYRCGSGIQFQEPYLEKWNGEIVCADCIEKQTTDTILMWIDRDIFEVLEKFEKIKYA